MNNKGLLSIIEKENSNNYIELAFMIKINLYYIVDIYNKTIIIKFNWYYWNIKYNNKKYFN